jgi:ribosomal protein L24E
MRCTYCTREIPKGTGTMYVFKSGVINYFCSKRCYSNAILMHRKMNKKELEAHK